MMGIPGEPSPLPWSFPQRSMAGEEAFCSELERENPMWRGGACTEDLGWELGEESPPWRG